MKLHQLYKRSIERHIDPVAKVDNRADDVVRQEIEEYFFTDKVIEHLYTILTQLTSGSPGTTGFWINGYYGSGKSHFLKYVYYCLTSPYAEAALDRFRDALAHYEGNLLDQPVTVAQLQKVRKTLANTQVDTIMFNIHGVSKQQQDKLTVTQTFFNRFNHFRGYHKSDLRIARFEQQLDRAGHLDAFKEAVSQRIDSDWDDQALGLVDFQLDQVIDALSEASDLDLESTRKALERSVDYSPEEFVDEVKRFLRDKPDDYRLVFLLDEVSQFMEGNPNLLVDLQTIVEMLATRCENQVWVLCTAQQKLEDLATSFQDRASVDYSYGKIIARFQALPLEAQQADWIAKKRILEKHPDERRHLEVFYTEKETPITNNFTRDKDAYPGYTSKEQFVDAYPLVPYQFALVKQIIQSFDRAGFFVQGVSGTERSLIGITHQTAKGCKDQELGFIVPLDAFYNSQITDHLTFEARNMIDKGLSLSRVQEDRFWQRVVRALFLLSNLTQEHKFPATAENLTFVLYDEIDPPKVELSRRVQEVLDYLARQNVVSETDGMYRFLQEEEIRVKNEIDSQPIRRNDRLDFLKEIVDSETKWSKRAKLEGSNVDLHLRIDELEASTSGALDVQFLISTDRDPQELAFERAKADLVFCLNEHFTPEQRQKLDEVVKVNTFKRHHLDQAVGARREAIELFSERARTETLPDLRSWFAQALGRCSYISAQTVHDAAQHNGGSAAARYTSILDEHLGRLYPKRGLATAYAGDRTALKAAAERTQQELAPQLSPAEREVNQYLKLKRGATLADVLRHFDGQPFGWRDTEVLHVLLSLEQHNKWRFKWNNEEVGRKAFAENGVSRSNQSSITLHEQEDIDPTLLHEVQQAVNQRIFNETLLEAVTDPRRLNTLLEGVLERKASEARTRATDHAGQPFAPHFSTLADRLETLRQERDAQTRFQQIVDEADELAELVDRAVQLRNFLDQQGESYRALQQFVAARERDFDALEPADLEHARKLRQYVRTDDLPHEQFVKAKAWHQAVAHALDARVETLRRETVAAYETAFDELEARRSALGVTDVLPDRGAHLQTLQRYDDLAHLEREKLRVSDFRATYLTRLHEAAQAEADEAERRETESFSVLDHAKRQELETEDDVEAFVGDLREQLLDRVRAGTIVILR